MIKEYVIEESHLIPKLAFHTMTDCDAFITIFGGLTDRDEFNGNLYFLKRNNRKTILTTNYERNISVFPKPRHSHSADYDYKNKCLYVFGGYGKEKPNLLNELCVLELKNFPNVTFQSVRALDITARCRHSSFINQKRIYFYGGYGLCKSSNVIKILNDFYYIDIHTGNVREVISKGGREMFGYIFKITTLDKNKNNSENINEYAFFSNDLSNFFIFNIVKEVFTKVEIKFLIPESREFFTIDKLKNNQIILFGGSFKDVSYKDTYILESYTHEKTVEWMWNRIDILGSIDYGYSGHCTLVLENSHILIHGGTINSFDCLKPDIIMHEPLFSKRLQLLNIFNSYEWFKPSIFQLDEEEEGKSPSIKYSLTRTFTKDDQDGEKSLMNSIMHICAIIPKDVGGTFDKLFIHGGEREDQTLCKFHTYNLKDNVWLTYKKEDDSNFSPQLKGHACTTLWLGSGKMKNFFIIISGGLTIDHSGNQCNVIKSEIDKKKLSNQQIQNCSCRNETVSSNIYAFHNDIFINIHSNNDDFDLNERIKRFGHSMIYLVENGYIFMMGGFRQYKGFVFDLIVFKVQLDVNSNKKVKNINFELTYKILENNYEDLDSLISPRMYASVTKIFNHIVIFGGIRNDVILNDMYILNVSNISQISVKKININYDNILPRFGSSSVTLMDEFKDDVGRILIFGGSSFCGEKLDKGILNELLVFHIQFNSHDSTFKIDYYTPCTYGFSEKRIFHSSVLHSDKMYTFGGLNSKFQILSIPSSLYNTIDSPLEIYEADFTCFDYKDWENGKTFKFKKRSGRKLSDKNVDITKEKGEKNGLENKSDNNKEPKSITKNNNFLNFEIEENISNRTEDQLINDKSENNSFISNHKNFVENNSAFVNESNNLLINSNNNLFGDKDLPLKNSNNIYIYDTSQAILSSNKNSKKAFVLKKSKNKAKTWDEDYDW